MTAEKKEIVYNDSEGQMYSRIILCIEEHDDPENPTSIDNRVFIGWDDERGEFFLRGRRQDTAATKYVPYAFRAVCSNDVYDFIEFIMGSKGAKSITFYNFNNIVEIVDEDLTYEFFESHMENDYDIAGYDNVKLRRGYIKRTLSILRNIYNISS